MNGLYAYAHYGNVFEEVVIHHLEETARSALLILAESVVAADEDGGVR